MIPSLEVVENLENVLLIMIVLMLQFVKIQNAEIHVKRLEFVERMQFVVPSAIRQLVAVHQMQKVIQRSLVISSSAQTTTNVTLENLA